MAVWPHRYGLLSTPDALGVVVKEEPSDTTVLTSSSDVEQFGNLRSEHSTADTAPAYNSYSPGVIIGRPLPQSTSGNNATKMRKAKELFSGNKLLKCGDCDIVFSNRSELKAHMVQTHSRNEFKCKYCGKSFLTVTGLHSHVPLHDGQWKFNCHLCGKGFQRRLDFEGHMNKHNNVKFICPNCEGAYYHKANWLKHKSRCEKGD